jgi:hypothetical protein
VFFELFSPPRQATIKHLIANPSGTEAARRANEAKTVLKSQLTRHSQDLTFTERDAHTRPRNQPGKCYIVCNT